MGATLVASFPQRARTSPLAALDEKKNAGARPAFLTQALWCERQTGGREGSRSMLEVLVQPLERVHCAIAPASFCCASAELFVRRTSLLISRLGSFLNKSAGELTFGPTTLIPTIGRGSKAGRSPIGASTVPGTNPDTATEQGGTRKVRGPRQTR